MNGKVKYIFVGRQLSISSEHRHIRVSHQIGQKARNSEGFSVPGRENGYCLDARQTLILNDNYLKWCTSNYSLLYTVHTIVLFIGCIHY